jgi:WD40 repeat protein
LYARCSVRHIVALDRDRALSASDDNTLRLWDLATGDTMRVLEGHLRTGVRTPAGFHR